MLWASVEHKNAPTSALADAETVNAVSPPRAIPMAPLQVELSLVLPEIAPEILSDAESPKENPAPALAPTPACPLPEPVMPNESHKIAVPRSSPDRGQDEEESHAENDAAADASNEEASLPDAHHLRDTMMPASIFALSELEMKVENDPCALPVKAPEASKLPEIFAPPATYPVEEVMSVIVHLLCGAMRDSSIILSGQKQQTNERKIRRLTNHKLLLKYQIWCRCRPFQKARP